MQQKKLTPSLIKIYSRIKIFLYIFLLSLSALIITGYYGYRGVFPIDSFLIYDAGYKILNGYIPFRDYWSITGPILDFLQFIFFKIFGTNWFSYILHSASINLILTLTFFYFFYSLGLKSIYSLIYSISCSILAYPSVGTPFMDHHAVIFSLISLMFLIIGFKKKNNLLLFLFPIFLSISFFSKQIPSVYLTIIFFIFILIFLKISSFKNIDLIKNIIGGIFFSISIFFLILYLNKIPFENFLDQYLFYPIEIGNQRSSQIKFNFNNTIFQFKFIYFSLIPLIFIFYKLMNKRRSLEEKKDLTILLLIFSSTLIFIYAQILTKNQILIFFLIPFCLGISHFYSNKYYKKDFINFAIIFILIVSTLKFHLRFNENKKFMELTYADMNLAINAITLDKSLKGLKWITPNYHKDPNNELKKLIDIKKIIMNDKSNLIIITDYQILPSITKIKNIAPNKWFDNLSVPRPESNYFYIYKEFFLKNLKKQKISTIYTLDGKEVFIKDFLEKGCYEKEYIEKYLIKLSIQNCF